MWCKCRCYCLEWVSKEVGYLHRILNAPGTSKTTFLIQCLKENSLHISKNNHPKLFHSQLRDILDSSDPLIVLANTIE